VFKKIKTTLVHEGKGNNKSSKAKSKTTPVCCAFATYETELQAAQVIRLIHDCQIWALGPGKIKASRVYFHGSLFL
jgi:hypothetical protein